jgi:hypothetical protein
MIKVMQSKFGKGQGNCLLAAVASVLHRSLESIPDFSLSGCGWFEDLYEWCLNENIGLLCADPKDFEHSIFLNAHAIGIFSVVGIEDENHAVVMKCSRQEQGSPDSKDALSSWFWQADIVHDPNPQDNYRLGDLVHLIFLIPEPPTT